MAGLPKTPRVVSYVDKWTKKLREEFQRRTKRAAEVVRQVTRDNVNQPGGPGFYSKPGEYPRRISGLLQRKVKTRLSKSSPYTFRVYDDAPYAGFLEYDTKGGKVIVPKKAKALSWIGDGGGRVFALKVIQGAITGRSFMRRSLVESREKIKAIYKRALPSKAKRTIRIG